MEQTGEQGIKALREREAALHVAGVGVTDERSGLKGCEGLESFTTRDGERAGL